MVVCFRERARHLSTVGEARCGLFTNTHHFHDSRDRTELSLHSCRPTATWHHNPRHLQQLHKSASVHLLTIRVLAFRQQFSITQTQLKVELKLIKSVSMHCTFLLYILSPIQRMYCNSNVHHATSTHILVHNDQDMWNC